MYLLIHGTEVANLIINNYTFRHIDRLIAIK
jgi:hypothetical protein